jgi:uncharacterized membrane protein
MEHRSAPDGAKNETGPRATTRRRAAAVPPHLNLLGAWLLAGPLALVVAFIVPAHLGWIVRAFAGWDAAMLVLLGLPWLLILQSDTERTRRRAAAEDPGRVGVLVLGLLASLIGLTAATALLRQPQNFAPSGQADLLVGLGIVAVVSAWVLLHTAFTFHYAHLYYRDGGRPGGMTFEGGPPDDLDFAYFAFTIGMTFQTSDVTITDKAVRRVALLHAVLSFVFNTAVLALAVNLIVGRLQ